MACRMLKCSLWECSVAVGVGAHHGFSVNLNSHDYLVSGTSLSNCHRCVYAYISRDENVFRCECQLGVALRLLARGQQTTDDEIYMCFSCGEYESDFGLSGFGDITGCSIYPDSAKE